MRRMHDGHTGRLGILISGRGSNMVELLAACERGEIPAVPALVVSNNPAAPGIAKAEAYGVPVRVIDHRESESREAHDRKLIAALTEADVDLVCLAGYLRLLSPVFVAAFANRVMNIHPSLLPAFPGLDAQGQAWRHGVKLSGCTVHFLTEELDAGPIICQAAVPVAEEDTPDTLADRILEQEHRLYRRAVRLFFEDRLTVEGRRVRVRE